MKKRATKSKRGVAIVDDYSGLLMGVSELLKSARRASSRAINALMTATYWEVGRRIVEFEQGGAARADYGREVLKQLAEDLTSSFGRGFSRQNLQYMRLFYLSSPPERICQTLSGKSSTPQICQTVSGKSRSVTRQVKPKSSGVSSKVVSKPPKSVQSPFELGELANIFPLPWSHYVRLLSVEDPDARRFYESEALRGGWTVRQLDRQISTLFYQRALLSKNKAAILTKGGKPQLDDLVTVDEEVRDPLVLEFLNLRDEYSESDLEDALIRHLETFLMELGGDFAFIGRQRRLRIGGEWYRVDLVFFHRRLRCLVVIDLKLGKFTHADAGQMHMYLNYAQEHWTQEGENPPVGLILCTEKDEAVAKYALDALPNKVLAREYQLALPKEKALVTELEKTRKQLEARMS